MTERGLNLLDLPIDILVLIITPLVTTPTTITLCPCALHTAAANLPSGIGSLLLVHPSIHAIACPILYSSNEFELDLTGKHGNAVRRSLEDAASTASSKLERILGLDDDKGSHYAALKRRDMRLLQLFAEPEARRRLRSLRVKLDRLRGWIDASIVPVLADMVLQGNLTELSICIYENEAGGRRGTNTGDVSVLRRPPLVGLLRLLADPYLRSAKLLVSPVHGRVWCPFHETTGTCETASAPTMDESAASSYSRGALVEIDWRAIVSSVLDPAGTELAVGWTEDAADRGRV